MTSDQNEVVAKERNKYERMWRHPAYSGYSPGEAALPQFTLPRPGDSLLDAGCGTGRAGLRFAQRGVNVTLLDLTLMGLDHGEINAARLRSALHLETLESPIHELYRATLFDWIYCVDVLEHIPPSLLPRTLDALASITRKGGYLQVACFDDACGRLINETLHMTVRRPEWWYAEVADRWDVTRDTSDTQYARFVVGAPHV